jgi:glycosyltransferase involved in cell wall biosynthesis
LSNYLYRIAIENDTKEYKVLLIPHFIDTEVFTNIYIHDNTVKDKIKICFCGTASEQNGILDLANTFDLLKEKHQNISLVIIGELSDDICSRMKSIFRYTDTSDIKVTGFLNRTDVMKIIKDCDILVNPRKSGTRAEAGFPTKLGEYFSSKKAVVSTDTGDISKYCNSWNELVIVPPDSPQSMANAISALIEDELKAREIGLNGYKWAAKNLDSRINAEKLLIFLRDNEK